MGAASVALGGCGHGGHEATLLIVINAPFSGTPYIGNTLANGASLAVSAIDAHGLFVNGTRYRLKLERLDNQLSPRVAVENVRQAISSKAVAIIDEGTGVDASWKLAADAHVPIGIAYEGGDGLVDAAQRPNVFRIAPTDRGIASRLAEYLIPKRLELALMSDTSAYGSEGAHALHEAFREEPGAVVARLSLAADATDFRPQVLEARGAGATALVVWAQPQVIAGVLTAARSTGWRAPVFTPPAGEDPIIRQQLSDHPDWVDGLTFASGRMTSEVGPGPFKSFRQSYESAFGPQTIGVDAGGGAEVSQPPDYAMYSYDLVNLLAAAIRRAGRIDGRRIISALERVNVQGANGDEREFAENDHEGLPDDDIYFARFRSMTFRPVQDDPLSATLPMIPQRRSPR